MSDPIFRLLPEGHPIEETIDDPVFTNITQDGEVYTLYRVVRITHELQNHPEGWTHQANIVRVHEPQLGVALLVVVDRVIRASRVNLSLEPRDDDSAS